MSSVGLSLVDDRWRLGRLGVGGHVALLARCDHEVPIWIRDCDE